MTDYTPRQWLPHERPLFPGSPATPDHSVRMRVLYGAIGALVAVTGSLGSALVSANQSQLQGSLGVTAAEIAWLPAVYVMTNMSANLILIRFRQQFGLRLFTEIGLVLFVVLAFAHLFVHELSSAIAVRAANGFVGAALTTLSVFYLLQAFPASARLRGLAIAIGLSQIGTPVARVISTELLEFGQWRGLYLLELGLSLLSLSAVLLVKLPPSDRMKVFCRVDLITIALLSTGFSLLCAVLSFGRIAWWLDTPWLGWALAGAIVLIVTGLAIEHFRAQPLIHTRWLSKGLMARLGLAIILIRMALSEQSVGAVGFLQAMGLTNDQMHTLFAVVLAGCLLGIAVSALTVQPRVSRTPALVALACVVVGALMDARSDSLTRPEQMMASQFLIGFGSTMFIGQALINGIGAVIPQPQYLVSFFVLFNMTQNLGNLCGSAFLGTFQTVREKYHSSQLVEHLTLLDPQVASRIQAGTAGYGATVADPALRGALGARALGAAATREANVLAYNDTYLAIAAIALLTMAWLIYIGIRLRMKAGQAPLPSPSTPASVP
ncbi:MFS transporter [Lysobacter terrae]